MKLFFISRGFSELSDKNSSLIYIIKEALSSYKNVEEVFDPQEADVILIHENDSFKNFDYIKDLLSDPIISKYPEKIFTINTDDSATGLLRGLYTCLPRSRVIDGINTAVSYAQFPNELVFSAKMEKVKPRYLAVWRGNIKSNRLRSKMLTSLGSKDRCRLELTNSWMKFEKDELEKYVDLIRGSKFSICPAGWAPATYRIYESMALGRCPVILADDFVPPKGPDWHEFALFFPENKIDDLHSFLLQHEHLAETLGKKAFEAWQEYFSPACLKNYYAEALLLLIASTPETSKAKELARWNSVEMFRSNKWTLPQRLINRIKYRNWFSRSLNRGAPSERVNIKVVGLKKMSLVSLFLDVTGIVKIRDVV